MKKLALVLAALLSACGGNSYYTGPVSGHFDGEKFFNPGYPRTTTFGTFLQWRLGLGPEKSVRTEWPDHVASPFPPAKPAARVAGNHLVITAVGHATFLIQTQNLNILTDPVWSERASPVSFAGPQRVMAPGILLEDLPPIDVIWVSHNHYEHLDTATLKALWEQGVARGAPPRIIVPLGNDTIIKNAHPEIEAEAYDWGQTVPLAPGVALTLEPMQHWSARWVLDRQHALWAAAAITTPGGHIYVVGDSGYNREWFTAHGAKYGGFRLALLPIGAYEPRWFMAYSHMNPAEAVQAKKDSQSRYAVGHHWGVFQLTDEAREQPLTDLAAALQAQKIDPATFRPLLPGESWVVPEK